MGQVCASTWFCEEGLTVTIWPFRESLRTCGQVPGSVPVPRSEPDAEKHSTNVLEYMGESGLRVHLPATGRRWLGGQAQVPLISGYIALCF